MALTCLPFLACQPGSGNASVTPEPATTCVDLGAFESGAYFVQDNMWGRGTTTDYEQCMSVVMPGLLPVTSTWRWPEAEQDPVNPKGYPFIGYGQDPWRPTSTTPNLPRPLGELGSLEVVYGVQGAIQGKYNLAFDIWITGGPGVTAPPEANVTREIMVWLEYAVVSLPAGWLVATVTIDGEDYDFYRGAGVFSPGYTRDYLGFLKRTPKREGTIDLSQFVAYLLVQGYVSPAEYFRNVFLGNEVWYGTGTVTIEAFEVRMQ